MEDGFRCRLDALSYELVESRRESELVTSVKKKRRGTAVKFKICVLYKGHLSGPRIDASLSS